MSYSLTVPTGTDVILEDLHEWSVENFTEAMRCTPSQRGVQPLHPDWWQLPRLADRFHMMIATEDDEILGYCVVNPFSDNPGLIHWLVVADAAVVGPLTTFFCEQAYSAWTLLVHGEVENEIIRTALLSEANITELDGEIVYAP